MTLAIQKNNNNVLSLFDILLDSIYSPRTYKFEFINNTTRDSQELVVAIVQDGNRFDFSINEGTDITFPLEGFYTYKLYEVSGMDQNQLKQGLMKVGDVNTAPTIPTAVSTAQTYVVANGGQ